MEKRQAEDGQGRCLEAGSDGQFEIAQTGAYPLAEEFWKAELDHDLSQLDFISKQLETVEAKLNVLAHENPHVQRLMTIPGVGRKTAEVLVAAIDDPHRFRNAREVSSYIGLVPKQYQSGKTDRYGRITKRGSRLLRTMLVACAWASLRYNAWAQAVYERIHGGQKSRRKKAGIALARKLAVVAWARERKMLLELCRVLGLARRIRCARGMPNP